MLSAVVLQTLSELTFINSKFTHRCGKDFFFQLENLWTQRLFHFFSPTALCREGDYAI